MSRNPVKIMLLFVAGVILAIALLGTLMDLGLSNKDPYPEKIVTEILKSPEFTIRDLTRTIDDLVYYKATKRDSIIPVLRNLLSHSEAEIRFVAARYLYILGDDSGSKAVRRIIAQPEAVMVPVQTASSQVRDLRMDAAFLATQFRDKRAADEVWELYGNTKSPALMHCLAKLQAYKAGPIIMEALRNQPTWELMEDVGLLKHRDAEQFIASALNDERMSSSIRLSAAWALTQFRNDEPAVNLIRDYADNFLRRSNGDGETARRAVKYLGTLQDQESIQLLEQIAQRSTRGELVQTALINLIFNHPSSKVGVNLLLNTHMYGGSQEMSYEMARSLAAASKNPKLMAALNDRRNDGTPGTGTWFRDRIGQAKWSIWGWADASLVTTPKEY